MKDVSFKAFYKPNKKIYDVLNIDFEHKEALLKDEKDNSTFRLGLDEIKLLPYSGLKSEFGEYKIYEGDVIRKKEWVSNPNGGGELRDRHGVVTTVDGFLVFVSRSEVIPLYDLRYSDKSIVGNIFINPELVKLVNDGN
jgi:yopX protein